MRSEGRLVDVIWMDTYLMVSRSQIELGEELRTMQLVKQLVNHRYRVLVLDSCLVQLAVVDAESPSSVFLAN